MQYRRFGQTGFDVSALGFGLMRLPRLSDDPADLDERESIRLVHEAVDSGVNYLDTAYGYHGEASERLAAKALKGGYREKVRLATKLPSFKVETEDDFERFLNEQLEKLETEYIDVYLLHALTAERWDNVYKLGVTEFLDRALADGRILHAGFSFHDELDVFKEIVDSHKWAMCLIQLNIMDHDYQAGVEGLRYAANQGLGCAIMEPLRGGKLAENVPDEIREVWARSGQNRSPAEWALRWVLNFPEVSVVLSGMGTRDHLRENMRVAAETEPNSMTESELQLVEEVRQIYRDRIRVACTDCGYCVPCSEGVDIPRIFRLYNEGAMYNSWEVSRRFYSRLLEDDKGPLSCTECRTCEEACPQGIPIAKTLKEAHRHLSGQEDG